MLVSRAGDSRLLVGKVMDVNPGQVDDAQHVIHIARPGIILTLNKISGEMGHFTAFHDIGSYSALAVVPTCDFFPLIQVLGTEPKV